jgi:small subunit ribosomal protein S5
MDGRNNRNNNQQRQRREPQDGIEEKVLLIRRLSKKTKGGNYISFSALVVVGDNISKVGIGLGRGLEVPQAIKKAILYARKNMLEIPVYEETLPHDIKVKFKSSNIILKPAPKGAGLKVGSVVRSILSLGGVKNASGKILGSRNQVSNVYAVMKALESLKPRK